MGAHEIDDRVRILAGLHTGKAGTVSELDGGGYWVRPDGAQTPAPYEAYELEAMPEGTLDLQAIGAETIAEFAPDSTERTADDDAGNPDMWFSTTTPLIGPEDLGEDVPELDDDGTEAEALAPVEVPRSRFAPPVDAGWIYADFTAVTPEPVTDLRPRWSQAGLMSVRVVA